jgi:hypothetical protein
MLSLNCHAQPHFAESGRPQSIKEAEHQKNSRRAA